MSIHKVDTYDFRRVLKALVPGAKWKCQQVSLQRMWRTQEAPSPTRPRLGRQPCLMPPPLNPPPPQPPSQCIAPGLVYSLAGTKTGFCGLTASAATASEGNWEQYKWPGCAWSVPGLCVSCAWAGIGLKWTGRAERGAGLRWARVGGPPADRRPGISSYLLFLPLCL